MTIDSLLAIHLQESAMQSTSIPSTSDEAQDADYFKTLPNYLQKALVVKNKASVTLAPIKGWSRRPEDAIRPFQQKGIVWQYFAMRGVLADSVGLGKTVQALGLIQLLKSRGEPHRTLVLTTKSAQIQWHNEIKRFTSLTSTVIRGKKSDRVRQYAARWDVMIGSYPLLLRDYQYLDNLVTRGQMDLIILDEASAIRNHTAQTSQSVKALTRRVRRIIALDATPIQTSLPDFHSLLETLHMKVFGSLPAFELRYIRRTPTRIRRGNAILTENKISGYKNMREFRRRIEPFVLRRRSDDPTVSAQLPPVVVKTRWLELPKKQRQAYDAARRGITLLFQEGNRRKARASFHTLIQACDSTVFFGETSASAASCKADLLIQQLTTELAGEKVVVFAQYKKMIAYLQDRMATAGIPSVRITGEESTEDRATNIAAFWSKDASAPRVIIGTSAMERAINLQNSAYIVCINQLFNPQRMQQLVGRIQRIGSVHPRVVMINYLTEGTIEERLTLLQQQRSALFDYVFNEQSDIFEQLTDDQLQYLIKD